MTIECFRCGHWPCECDDGVALLCGDSIVMLPQVIKTSSVSLVVTDPPYGVKYEGGCPLNKRQLLAGDDDANLYRLSLPLLADAMADDAALYVFFAHSETKGVWQAIHRSKLTIRANLIWVKNQAQMGRWSSQYKYMHEPFLYCHKKGKSPAWYGPTNEVSVWNYPRSARNTFHPTQKPVALVSRCIENSSKAGDLVLDPFAGSGSVGVACKIAGRRCILMELDAEYCNVINSRLNAVRSLGLRSGKVLKSTFGLRSTIRKGKKK